MQSGRVGEAVCEAGQCKALRRRATVEQEHGDLALQAAPDGPQGNRLHTDAFILLMYF